MSGEEPETMDTYQHEDGHDIADTEKGRTDPDGSSHAGDLATEVGLPGKVGPDTGPTTAGHWARDESASGPVTETATQPPESGKVLDPGVSENPADGS